jgi:hypothetical protein
VRAVGQALGDVGYGIDVEAAVAAMS